MIKPIKMSTARAEDKVRGGAQTHAKVPKLAVFLSTGRPCTHQGVGRPGSYSERQT